ncbi:2,3-diaminopropionate biosynthesis protein SbnA [Photobacterium galatheae]|uniref:cysteine synthase n=1 Tax=Photobacterium galatheae TaxID=1654360 RepID=A0A066RSJ6_9GAMM|nr:2,3-diaminopropionate biosynthesis protein SbnA [Photobacterium galatheae]KDM93430.1 cysteine synthase [Photobacterium galatheae]MCM0147010.1 2,3-diaminopropionate biosynthesis protein SbnA [Photobacterium galatheae]
MIINNPMELVFDDLYLENKTIIDDSKLFIKLEGHNIGGSIKIKPAIKMIEKFEMQGLINENTEFIESSSGNLGVALSIVCAIKGYKFNCVVDPNIQPTTENLIKSYGTHLIKVTEKDSNGGYLSSRINLIKSICRDKPNYIWVNQYENIDNVEAHYQLTAKSIYNNIKDVDYIFVGSGTTGTLGGISRFFKQKKPNVKIIAVDSIGSVTFGFPSGSRKIPGLGTSLEPPIAKFSLFDEIIHVPEVDTIRMCNNMAKQGLLFGGSTGTILSGVEKYKDFIPKNSTVVALSPDYGERYLDTIYSNNWVSKHYQ